MADSPHRSIHRSRGRDPRAPVPPSRARTKRCRLCEAQRRNTPAARFVWLERESGFDFVSVRVTERIGVTVVRVSGVSSYLVVTVDGRQIAARDAALC